MGCLYYIPARRFPGGRVPDVLKARVSASELDAANGGDSGGVSCLEDAGLGHLAGVPLTYRAVRNAGPDAGAGLVIGLRVALPETGCFLGEQTWQPVDGGDLFVGWYTDRKPGPEVFLRKDALAGTSPVTLADGQVWAFVPSGAVRSEGEVLRFVPPGKLPTVLSYDKAGELHFALRPQDAGHFEASEWIFNYLTDGSSRQFIEIMKRVVVCLQARYHIGFQEFAALGLFTTDLNDRVVYAALGIDYEEAVEGKKNEGQIESDMSSGSPGDSPA